MVWWLLRRGSMLDNIWAPVIMPITWFTLVCFFAIRATDTGFEWYQWVRASFRWTLPLDATYYFMRAFCFSGVANLGNEFILLIFDRDLLSYSPHGPSRLLASLISFHDTERSLWCDAYRMMTTISDGCAFLILATHALIIASASDLIHATSNSRHS